MNAIRSTTIQKLANPKLWIVVILILAAFLRLYDLTDEPLELHPTRQFRALIIARSFYYPSLEDISAEKLEFAEGQAAQVGLIEPSILEFLSAQLYKLAGKEITWLGRIFPITAWLLGGLALFSLARRISSTSAAFLSLIYYFFLPFGARFSRVLMADPIMVAGSVASLWALYSWQQNGKTKYAVLVGLLTGVTILLKSVAGIILILPFALLILSSFSLKEIFKNRQIWLILLLAALPTALFYYYGLVIDGRLATQFKGRFFPEIWTDLVFYKSWGLRIIQEFNLLAFAAGLLGIVLAKTKQIRLMLFGWWTGYFIYAMLFAYHTWTHDYYHLPMVPLAAVSLAPTTAYLEELAKRNNFTTTALILFLCICLGIGAYGSDQTVRFLSATDHRTTRASLEQLGAAIKAAPPRKIIGLTDDYETSFAFYNFLRADHWPSLGDMNFRELQGADNQAFEQLWQITDGAGYFFVTDHRELKKQPRLGEQLSLYPIIAEDQVFTLYSLTELQKP
jgi:hypothetical protein